MVNQKYKDASLDMLEYIDASPTAAHATREAIRRLEASGYRRLDEADSWKIGAGEKFYVTRNDTSVIAARVGSGKCEEDGFRIVGAHTDFPGLRLKPNGIYSKNGYIQLGVEVYGGPIVHSWFDRDLGIAGRLVVEGEPVLFDIRKPVCRIPNLAPHIRVNKNEELKFNKQDHMPPVVGLGDESTLEAEPVRKLIAESAGVDESKISTWSVEIFDLQPGTLGGMSDEFVFVRSIDNLASCHAALEALTNAPDKPFTQVIALFDNEEIGSATMQGAASRFLDAVIERICLASESPREAFYRAIANSIIMSVDGAHAINPNYAEAHEPRHHLVLNGGVVHKVNANERYTGQIDAVAHLVKCAEKAECPLQKFVARTDVGTGSTIGPMTATRLGIRSVDVGGPILSMHSTREMAGTEDQLHMINLIREHFS